MTDYATCLDCGDADPHTRGYCQTCYRRRLAGGQFEYHEYLDVTWHEDALCARVGGDMWFPEKGESSPQAKAICQRCPVRAECLDYSLTWRQHHGVWGGVGEAHRRLLLKELGLDFEDAA